MYIILCVEFILNICLFYLIVILNQTNWTLAFKPQNIKTEHTHFHKYFDKSCKKKWFLLDSIDCDREKVQTTLVKDGMALEKYPKYNKYPNFCTGRYNFFEFVLKITKKQANDENFPKFIAYLHLITKLDFILERYGSFSILFKDQYKNKPNDIVNPRYFYNSDNINTLTNEFDDTSLIKIKQEYQKDDFNDDDYEFIKQLDNQKIETYDVKDLITKIVPEKDVKAELRKFVQDQIISKYDLNSLYENIKPRGWEYIPSKTLLNIKLFLEDISTPVDLVFNLYPGIKPLVIDRGKIVIDKGVATNFYSDDSSPKNELIAYAKARPVINYSTRKFLSDDLNKSKIKLITISGSVKARFNLLFKILELLALNSPPYRRIKIIPQDHSVRLSDYTGPIYLKSLAVYVNSKFRFVIPLLTYFDFTTGVSHLCNSITTFDFKPDVVWSPTKTGYGRYNKYFLPIQFRNAGFFSSNQIDFKPEVIFNLLSSYLGFWRLIEDHESTNKIKGNTHLKKTFEEVKGTEKVDGEDEAKKMYKVYYVGGKYKMIYKDEDGSIILNLLL